MGSLLVFGVSFGDRVAVRAERETSLTETTIAPGLFQLLLIVVIDRHKSGSTVGEVIRQDLPPSELRSTRGDDVQGNAETPPNPGLNR